MRSAWGLDSEHAFDWRQQAVCGPDTAEWFYFHAAGGGSGGGNLSQDNVAALRLCMQCPVRQQCYEHAEANPEADARIAGGAVWRRGTVRHPPSISPDEVERIMRRRATWRASSKRKYAQKRAAT